MDIVIKKLTKNFLEEEIDSFISILKNEPYEYWEKKHFLKELPLKFELSLFALFQNKLIGYIIASKKNNISYIHKFMVNPDYRKMKIGTRLQNVFEQNAMDMGFKSIQLSVISTNENAIRFYEKNGYYVLSKKIDSINNIELIIMQKILE